MPNTQQATIELNPDKYQLYVAADKEIGERLGHSPGPEFLMSLMLENEEDSADLADIYCHTVLRHANG